MQDQPSHAPLWRRVFSACANTVTAFISDISIDLVFFLIADISLPFFVSRRRLLQSSLPFPLLCLAFGITQTATRSLIRNEALRLSTTFSRRDLHFFLLVVSDCISGMLTTSHITSQIIYQFNPQVQHTALLLPIVELLAPWWRQGKGGMVWVHSLCAWVCGKSCIKALLGIVGDVMDSTDRSHMLTNDVALATRKRIFVRNLAFRPSYNSIRICVARENILQDSISLFLDYPPEQIRDRLLRITFLNEAGVDVGALAREWMAEMGKHLALLLFHPMKVDGLLLYQPHPRYSVLDNYSQYVDDMFEFAGMVFAKSFYETIFAGDTGMSINMMLTENVWNVVLDIPDNNALRTLERVDPALARSLQQTLDSSLEHLNLEDCLNFTVVSSIENGESVTDELVADGSSIIVTEENKSTFVRLYAEHRLYRCNQLALVAFARGFQSLLPLHCLRMFRGIDMNDMLCGVSVIDVEDWKQNTLCSGGSRDHPTVKLFWDFVTVLNQTNRRRLLQFATGSCVVVSDSLFIVSLFVCFLLLLLRSRETCDIYFF
eukprot:c8487_g1_i1.p1 GENE.c8487_g1_i1~~c8487_g1_i1.p1  ORF type:complete len:546 (+),score=128.14 c8487_g1_i1:38-1675(+)